MIMVMIIKTVIMRMRMRMRMRMMINLFGEDMPGTESCKDSCPVSTNENNFEESESIEKRSLHQAEFSQRDCVILSWITLLDEWTLLPGYCD